MGERNTAIEYSFHGDTLDLQQAVKKVSSLISTTVKDLKKLQDGTLTKDQKSKVKVLKEHLKSMQDAVGKEKWIDDSKRRRIKTAGTYTLREAEKLANSVNKIRSDQEKAQIQEEQNLERAKQREQQVARKAQIKAEQEALKIRLREERLAAKEKEEIEKLTSIAGQENAKQHANYLANYADKFKHTMEPEAYYQLIHAVEEYRQGIKQEGLEKEELAEITRKLQNVYKDYAETLQSTNRAQQQAAKGILNFSDFIKEAQRQVQVATKTFSFWLQVIRKVFQYLVKSVKQYLDLVERISKSNAFSGSSDQLKKNADAWQKLGRQASMFTTNLGGAIINIFAPVAEFLTNILMLLNAVLATIAKTSALANEATARESGTGLTDLDEINQQTDKQEDDTDKFVKGLEEMKKKIEPIISLFESLGEIIAPLWQLFFGVSFDGFLESLNLVAKGLQAILWPINWVFKQFQKLLDLIAPGIKVFDNFKGSMLAIFVILPLLVKGITALATSFGGLTKSVFAAIGSVVKWIATQIKATAEAIVGAVKAWILAGAYWKVAIAAIAAAGVLALVVAGIVIAATATVKSQEASSTQKVPGMAKGGLVRQPTLALVGEGSFNEVVIPLGNSPQYKEMKQSIAEQVVSKQNKYGTTVTRNEPMLVKLMLNDRELARALTPALDSTHNQTAVRLKTR